MKAPAPSPKRAIPRDPIPGQKARTAQHARESLVMAVLQQLEEMSSEDRRKVLQTLAEDAAPQSAADATKGAA
jgi:hypothetical protein